jgi:1-acyl-sn-glycerol-3-phosphate acyltransferase
VIAVPAGWWPRERPIRTIIGFLGVAIGATVAHRVRFERTGHIPGSGPALVVANHLATTETLALARLITGHRRFPHFLAKAEVFEWPVIGWVLRMARQIPVLRGTADAAGSLDGATAEFQRGHLVVIYPEGHLTRTADLRPGPGRSGAARLALANPGVPLIPVGMWGARPGRRHLLHRHRVTMVVGEPIEIAGWDAADPDSVSAVTAAIMAAIRGLVEQARGVPFPD